MKEKAVIDRFEGDQAVLLVGEKEHRLITSRKALPRAAREGHWLQVELDGDTLLSASIDRDETEAARKRITDKLNRLRQGKHLE